MPWAVSRPSGPINGVIALDAIPCLWGAGGGGLFSAFNSGHHRGDRTKAQNVRGGCLLEGPPAVATAVVKGLSSYPSPIFCFHLRLI